MVTKIFGLSFMSFFLMACGPEVKLASKKLETYNNITMADAIKVDKTGTLIRKNLSNPQDQIMTGSTTMAVSKYSSHHALTYINSRAEGIQIPIRYKGEVKNSEILVEYIEAQ